jgi:hypothetical protein
VISGCIQALRKDWARYSALYRLIFESTLSLRAIIEAGKVDLSRGFEIEFIEYDSPLDFPGYSVGHVHGANNLVRLEQLSPSG